MTRDEIPLARISNGEAAPLEAVPSFRIEDLASLVSECLAQGLRICAYFGSPAAAKGGRSRASARASGGTELFVVLADDERNGLYLGRSRLEGATFPSIAERFPQAQLFEREIAEQFGVEPVGHPWLKPVRYARFAGGELVQPLPSALAKRYAKQLGAAGGGPAAGGAPPPAPGTGDFFRVEGEEVHEVAVGPVHAGVIEPGHFRFQCHGERVFHLEIALGYQHRGVEEALIGGPDARSLHYAETACGDSTIAHATSYCAAVEALADARRSARSQAVAAIALELERLACHVGDLGALSGDVGFLPTASYCGRIRGDFLNMTALICGNRFGRGLRVPGGLRCDLEDSRAVELGRRLAAASRDAKGAIELLWDTQSVMARFEDTGRLSREAAIELGVVGPAARASGLSRDVRFDHSAGIYRLAHIPVSTYDSGDVLGRAFVRWLEIQQSIAFIEEQLGSLPGGEVRDEVSDREALAPSSIAVALTEGWRGEVCHVAITDEKGAFARYKIVDPSFHNWPALAYALRDQEISDFPLCNKSFNLSYCGHDL
jgi:Ni,Fe-hydrogenase III large subunit